MEFWQHILKKLKLKQRLYLMVVVHHHGSTPGRTGFKMIVAEDGFIHGSIGGGIMEYNLVEEARSMLQTCSDKSFLKKQVHSGQKQDGSGMVCSGEQTVAFVPLNSDKLRILERITSALSENQTRGIVLNKEGLHFSKAIDGNKNSFDHTDAINWEYYETIGFKDSLYIIGGGHVSLAVSDLFVSMGFYVTVMDNRDGLNTFELNKSAHKKIIIDFNDVENHIENKESALVAIMTNSFIDDKIVLGKLMGKDLSFLGILGSKAKLKLMWDLFKKEGVSEVVLSKVSGPIGLDIKSQTPIEIAISIAAEMIQLRNK